MKLLIDIPEHVYEHAKEMTEDSRDEGEAMRAIAKGSPARCKGVDEAEKERLIKKNMLSIENRVRHAFNQGYEMGVKKNKSEIPTSCGDAISRQEVLDATVKRNSIWNMITNSKGENLEEIISQLPSVSPQQRTGRWERMSDLPNDADDRFKCSHCGNIVHYNNVMDLRTFSRWCGRCGSDNG